MRARILASACALWAAGCLYPEYSVTHDGGAAGTTGAAGGGGRGGSTAGGAGAGGSGGSLAGVGGSAGGTAGRGGSAGATAGSTGAAGSAGTTGTAGAAGSSAGRGGTTGAAGSTAGTGGGAAGRGGTTGTAGSAAGTGGSGAGRGGTTGSAGSAAGSGGSSTGGSTVAPSWLSSISVVYQFDGQQGQLGAEAHGDETLHMEEDGAGSILPIPDATNAIEGGSGKLTTLNGPAYFRSRSGAALPSVFSTDPGTSFTTGGWFRIDSSVSSGQQFLVNDEGPGTYQGGFVFYLDQTNGSFGARTAAAYCRIGTSDAGFNYKELETGGNIGPDTVAGNRWVHLVCRFDATTNQLSIFVAGVISASNVDTTHPIKTGPGPFIVGCDVSFCAFIGNVDEVFFTRSALNDPDITRIYACGIDGSRCRCNGPGWANCGFLNGTSCGSLNACNANP